MKLILEPATWGCVGGGYMKSSHSSMSLIKIYFSGRVQVTVHEALGSIPSVKKESKFNVSLLVCDKHPS